LKTVYLLFNHGIEPEESGAATAAAEVENMDALALLVEKVVDLEKQAIWWMVTDRESLESKGTMLYRVCRVGKKRAVEFLMERGANVDAVDEVGRSCLHGCGDWGIFGDWGLLTKGGEGMRRHLPMERIRR
jgi:hypothetical protein